MFTVASRSRTARRSEVRLAPYGIIARHGTPPDLKNFYILHEGVILVADGNLQEIDYADIQEFAVDPAEGAAAETVQVAQDGWIGFTDHYWMSTLVPPAGQPFTAVTKYTQATDTFQTDMRLPVMAVPDGDTAEASTSLFAGAKEWATIRDYQHEHEHRPLRRRHRLGLVLLPDQADLHGCCTT